MDLNNTVTVSTPYATGNYSTMEVRAISLGLFIFVCVLSVLGVAMAIGMIVFNILHKNIKFIKMSSPNINALIAVGGAILYFCCILFGIDYGITNDMHVATVFCQMRTWLLVMAFTLVYGAIFSKTWRVHRIFTRATIERTVIRDNKLIVMISMMLLVDIVILAFWQGFDPLTCNKYIVDKKPGPRKYEDPPPAPDELIAIQICSSDYTYIWLCLVFVYKAVLLLGGTYLSWSTRHVTLPPMNDATSIIISVYTCVILTAMVTSLSAFLVTWPNLWYACIVAVIFICTSEVLLLQNVPKIYAWKKIPPADLSKFITSSYLATTQNNRSDRAGEDHLILSAENTQLKISLSENEETLQALQQHVKTAEDNLLKIEIDSGCDDMSTSSAQEENGSVDKNTSIDETQAINLKRKETLERKSRDRRSVSSANSWKQFKRVRNSIAEDLKKADFLSSTLRDSISRDLNRLRRMPVSVYNYDDIEHHLAESLRGCYHLSEADAASLVSMPSTYANRFNYRERGDDDQSGQFGSELWLSCDEHYRHDTSCTCSCSRNSSFRSYASRQSFRSTDSSGSRFSRRFSRRHSLPRQYRFHASRHDDEEKMVTAAADPEILKSYIAYKRQIGTDTYV
ncbi:putative G-protein coupled receptor 156 [Saccoglossus kowalevskii]